VNANPPLVMKTAAPGLIRVDVGKGCLLLLTPQEFRQGILRGKSWRRRAAFLQRSQPAASGDVLPPGGILIATPPRSRQDARLDARPGGDLGASRSARISHGREEPGARN